MKRLQVMGILNVTPDSFSDGGKYQTVDDAVALEAGATMINDQWRGTYDETILDVASEYEVPIFLMHNNTHASYSDVVEDMIEELWIILK